VIVREDVTIAERFAIADLYTEYATALDDRRYDDWLALFVEDCTYQVIPRENEDRGLPLATLWFESKGMLRDRIYGITQTLYHEPYYQRHLVTNFRIAAVEDGFTVDASYLVIRTKSDALSEVYQAGRYRDVIVRDGEVLRFKSKRCIFDSETIPNSLIYPV
jgi:salicylate 5-hydroxylase small subunit